MLFEIRSLIIRALFALLSILRYAGIGALISGIYGILHDQITFALAPEYFTKFKFNQFADADFGWPDWAFAGTVGFLATWWVGMAAGWMIGRFMERRLGRPATNSEFVPYLLRMLGVVCIFGILGFAFGTWKMASVTPDHWVSSLSVGITDPAAFVRVGYIHNFGYLGAVVGLVAVGLKILGIRKSEG